jgi:hypothetical protein
MTLIEKYNYNFKDKLNNYEKFISRQSLARSLVRYELFKNVSAGGQIIVGGLF